MGFFLSKRPLATNVASVLTISRKKDKEEWLKKFGAEGVRLHYERMSDGENQA